MPIAPYNHVLPTIHTTSSTGSRNAPIRFGCGQISSKKPTRSEHGLDEPSVPARTVASKPQAFRGRIRVKVHVFFNFCLRLVIVIANYERGTNLESRQSRWVNDSVAPSWGGLRYGGGRTPRGQGEVLLSPHRDRIRGRLNPL